MNTSEETISIKRTPELEQYLVEQAFAFMTLENWIKTDLVNQLYDMQKEKVLQKGDILFIVDKVVEQYDNQFGMSFLLGTQDENIKELIKKTLEEKEANGDIEIVPEPEDLLK